MADTWKIIASATGIFGLIAAYTLEVPHLQNNLELNRLLWTALITGILVGGGLGYGLGRHRSELLERWQLFLGLTVLCILFMPLLLSWTNRHLAFQQPRTEHLELLRIEAYTGSRFGLQEELSTAAPDGYRIFVLRDTRILRLQYAHYPFPGKVAGDDVPITISRGLWGFEFVAW